MKPAYLIVDESELRLWGLTPGDRLRRQLARRGLVECRAPGELPADHPLLVLSGAHLFDARVLESLASTPEVVLRESGERDARFAAAHVAAGELSAALELLGADRPARAQQSPAPGQTAGAAAELLEREGLRVESPESLTPAFDERLRRSSTPAVLRIRPDNLRALEQRLFGASYKGVTDLVTKFAWPRPAQAVTRLCVRFGLRPNHVTSFGVLLTILAGVLFAQGSFGWGLVCAWLMTFLDTVDGKLARVTITSSRVGHVLDHGTDIIHPPLWYLAWGMGLGAAFQPVIGISYPTAIAIIFVGYIVGRLIEGSYQLFIDRSGIFLWCRFDSFFRLITARRNPNLILLTASLFVGRPDLGFEAVVWWTAVTTLVLLVRLIQALVEKARHGVPRPWMVDVDTSRDRSLAVRWFAPPSEPSAALAGTPGQAAERVAEQVAEQIDRGSSGILQPVPRKPRAGAPDTSVRIGVLTNPRSRANRLAGPEALDAWLAAHPDVLQQRARTPEEIAVTLAAFAQAEVDMVVINGGDGTVSAALEVLCHDSPFAEAPRVAVLPGGRTNMTAGDVGVRCKRPEKGLERLHDWAAQGCDPEPVVERHALRVDGSRGAGPRFGLFFSAAGIYQATVNCWNFRSSSRLPGMKTGLGTAVSVGTQVVEHLLGREPLESAPIRVSLDGEQGEETAYLALFVTTLERMALGMRPFWGDDSGPLHFTAVASEHAHLLRAAPALLRGRPNSYLKPEHGYASRDVHHITLEFEGGCTLDGEVLHADSQAALRLSAGPALRFVRV